MHHFCPDMLCNSLKTNLKPLVTLHTHSISDFHSEHFWLDYIPHLRNIASIEANIETNHALLSTFEGGDQSQEVRRRTRRSAQKQRVHYFDSVLKTSFRYCDEGEGKAIGQKLAKMKLGEKASS